MDDADLILGLDLTHRSHLAKLAPPARPRTFTLRQAAALSALIAASLRAGGLPEGAPPLPAEPRGRLDWLIAEIDAARGQEAAGLPLLLPAEASAPAAPVGAPEPVPGPLDVPDPHALGYQLHGHSVALVRDAVAVLAESVRVVVAAP